MMYSEFIDRTHYGETYITPDDYTKYIEPVYTEQEDDKNKFCKKFSRLHNKHVNEAVSRMISGISISELSEYVGAENQNYKTPSIKIVETAHNLLKNGFLKEFKDLYK